MTVFCPTAGTHCELLTLLCACKVNRLHTTVPSNIFMGGIMLQSHMSSCATAVAQFTMSHNISQHNHGCRLGFKFGVHVCGAPVYYTTCILTNLKFVLQCTTVMGLALGWRLLLPLLQAESLQLATVLTQLLGYKKGYVSTVSAQACVQLEHAAAIRITTCSLATTFAHAWCATER